MFPALVVGAIDLRDRIETFKTCITFIGWQTVDGRAHETILE